MPASSETEPADPRAELLTASEAGTAAPSTFATRRAARLAREAAGDVQPKGSHLAMRAGDNAQQAFTIREVEA